MALTEEEKLKKLNYQSFFATDVGKKVLDDLSYYCYEHRSTYVEGNHDKQNVNNGKRSVILYIRAQMKPKTEPKQETAIKE